jgi:hypothetical protein
VFNPKMNQITWALDGLPVQQSHDLVFKVRARQGGDWALAAAMQSGGAAEARTTHAVHVSSPPLLKVEMASNDEPLAVGSETTYEVRVSNRGTESAGAVRLRVLLPDCLQAVDASGPGHSQNQAQQVVFDPIEQMNRRVAAVYRVRVRAVSAGTGRVRVELTATGLDRPIDQERTCRVQAPAGPGGK